MLRLAASVLCLAALLAAAPQIPARAESQGVIATVNDRPVTGFDVDQRLKLMKILGIAAGRKQALQSLIDETIKLEAARKFKFEATDAQIQKQLERMAKAMGTDAAGLEARLKQQGISSASFRQYVAAQIGFSRMVSSKYRVNDTVKPEDVARKRAEIEREVKKRLAEIERDPRMKPVTVYTIQQIELPIENADDAMAAQLMQARAVEAMQFIQRYTGCKSAGTAAQGIFNVKVGKPIEADAAKLPKQLKEALDKAGTGKAIGPVRGKNGIQVIGFCGVRKLTPAKPKFEMPSDDQVANALTNDKFAEYEDKYIKELRQTAYIEYKDSSYSQ
jgi:peptidyl-prolyl cis-trans isomerase SurA